jgi:tetratricopeptide (TPR) repeat protein
MRCAALAFALAALVTIGCASRGSHVNARDPRPVVAEAERAIVAGSCVALHGALASMANARASGVTSLAIDRYFLEVSVLLDIREAELGLLAHRHVDALPAGRPVSTGQQALLELAEAVRSTSRGPREDLAAWQRGRTAARDRADAWRRAWSVPGDAVTRYAVLSLECWFGDLVGRSDVDRALLAQDAQALVAWKAATCEGYDVDALRSLVARDASFAEAGYLLALDALRTGRRDEAIAGVQAALAVLPEWPTALVTLGHVLVAVERFEDALDAYDAALRLRPDPPARVGRLQALSYLERHEAAIAQADELLAGGTWSLGDAHYWKAWNLARLNRLPEAADEASAAKRLMVGAGLMKLSGIIAFRRGLYTEARADLTAALGLADDDCDARFTLAAVEAAERRYGPAGEGFAVATACFRDVENQLATAGPELDARVLARRERERREARRQRGAAHLHAAEAFVNAGDSTNARVHLAAVAEFPEWAARSREIDAALQPPR